MPLNVDLSLRDRLARIAHYAGRERVSITFNLRRVEVDSLKRAIWWPTTRDPDGQRPDDPPHVFGVPIVIKD